MRIHKNGFTLSEVLITLSIVSIVAALTLPQVTSNAERRKRGAQLAKIYQNIEAKTKEYLYNHNANNGTFIDKIVLTGEGNDWQEQLIGNQGLYMYLAPNSNDTYKMNKTPGEFQLVFTNLAGEARYSGTRRILGITVDLNGFNKGPNESARDRFAFFMSNDGKLHADNDDTQRVINNGFRL